MWSFDIATITALALLASVVWTTNRGAPWVPTPMKKVRKMLEMAEVGPDDLLYDLGCGDGRMIVTAARSHGARAVGVEIHPLRYIWCQILITALGLRGRVKIVFGDMFKQDLSNASVVTCYLLQSTNERLQGKLEQELRPNSRVVSSDFTFPGLYLERKDSNSRIYLYHIGL